MITPICGNWFLFVVLLVHKITAYLASVQTEYVIIKLDMTGPEFLSN